MNANELRIGNLIYSELHSKNTDYTIVDIDFFGLSGYVKFWGIPLTEEWLLKFGFVEEFENKFYKNSLAIEVFENECIVYLGDFVDLAIKYVHDLQNLYFSITREELEFSNVAQHVEQ